MTRTLVAIFGFALSLVGLLAASACSPPAEGPSTASDRPARVVVVRLDGFVGCGVDAELLRQPLAEIVADLDRRVDTVVFAFDSGGGMLNRVGPLSDLIHGYFAERDIDCIGWIERAESAASIVALTIPDLWVSPDGTIGAAIGVREAGPGAWQALPPEEQEAVRFMVAAAASRGGHDPDVALRMTQPASSTDDPHGGRVFTGQEAAEFGIAQAANSIDAALDSIYGSSGWQIDRERSDRISRTVERAERVRSELAELYERLDRATASAAEGDSSAVGLAADVLDQLLELASKDDPATVRAVRFLGGFQRVSGAIDRVDALSDQNTP